MRRDRLLVVLGLAAIVVLALGTSANAVLIGELGVLDPGVANGGTNPQTSAPWAVGDQYHLAFVTNGTRDATDPDIATYHGFVQAQAAAVSMGGTTWYSILQTWNDPVRDTNAPPMTTSSGIFLVNSTKLADNGGDLANGPDVWFDVTEIGTQYVGRVATGSSRKPGDPTPGQTKIEHGSSDRTSGQWWQVYNGQQADQWHFYAISDPLSIVDAPYTWDTTPGTVGPGDGSITTGDGTWNTTNGNWTYDGGKNNVAWDNSANEKALITGTGGGTITLGEDINLSGLTFASTGNVTVAGGTLNFAPGSVIYSSVDNTEPTITSAITGSPDVWVARNTAYRPGGVRDYDGLTFAPTSGTVTLGTATVPYGTGDKAGLILGGTTTGNSVAKVQFTNPSWRYGSVTKVDSGEWTVGDVDSGAVVVMDGTLVANGTLATYYRDLRIVGGKLTGDATIFTSDRRGSPFVYSGATIAPGNSIGTIDVTWGTGGGNPTPTAYTGDATFGGGDYSFTLMDGSIYEWEVAGRAATDTIHIMEGGLFVQDMTLKILDAGVGDVFPTTEQLPVFTYDDGVTVDISGFADSFDTSALGPKWILGDLAMIDDGAGTVYLTGLSHVPEPSTFALAALGLLGLGWSGWRRRRAPRA